jgi:hypothetical protein
MKVIATAPAVTAAKILLPVEGPSGVIVSPMLCP